MAAKRKTKTSELAGQTDPHAPMDSGAFLAAAWPVLALLKTDLHARSESSSSVRSALEAAHAHERDADRTGDSFAEWRGHFIEQVAAAWLLSCVFVRTLEDRGLLGSARIAGPGAQDSQRLFFELAPSLTERDYLLTTFRELSRFPAASALFDGAHNPVWLLAPSAEAAKALLALFRAPSADAPAFRFGQPDTRFLGDLYQDLDEGVRKRFALLQTPDFIEHYILDRTLEPAIARFGLEETTLIDPTCGSGHFLLGAFDRLYEHRRRQEPDASERDAVSKALDAVAGSDINPFAVAIARLRLTLAALGKAGFTKLSHAPGLPLHLVVADSLLYNPQAKQLDLGHQEGQTTEAWHGKIYALEDPKAAREVLNKQYAAVVGNPPYITCKDSALREKYRQLYESCHREYSLAVPFTERFFQLGKKGGSIGMITANSFMKREFGKKLIEGVLPKWNLTRVENTSGAYIPGHGTPTVLLFGTAEPPQGTLVHAILANRGEPTTPQDPAEGLVWRSLIDHGDEVGFENEYISVARVQRGTLEKHPWSLGGGGASELKTLLEERMAALLGSVVQLPIGRAARVGMDDVYMLPPHVANRIGGNAWRDLLIGESVRDWGVGDLDRMLFPYGQDLTVRNEDDDGLRAVLRYLWPYRTALAARVTFQGVIKDAGLRWYEYMQYTASANRTPLSIAFAFVATHNHFVLDRGGKVFNRSAPIIKLPEGATEDDHLALLAYLNSSTACFWMKQVCFRKGGDQMGDGGRLSATSWEDRFEFSGTALQALPLPALDGLALLGAKLDLLGKTRSACQPGAVLTTWSGHPTEDLSPLLEVARNRQAAVVNEMTAVQETLDWAVYALVGLVGTAKVCGGDAADRPGSRAFERRLLNRTKSDDADRAWFARGGYKAATESVSELQQRRLCAIEESHELQILESLDFKRWWRPTDFDEVLEHAATTLLAERLELLTREARPSARSSLQQRLGADAIARGLASVPSLSELLNATVLLATEAVPFLATQRFTETGIEKHAEWQHTWDLQRREDAGEKVGEIPVPPKYDQKDYRDAIYWRLRGKLDVPKERFISYPGCESDEDNEPLYGWAGWNHLERAQALAALYNDRKDREGWAKERLVPMLAGILELLPWIKQWHNEPNSAFDGLRLGDYFEGFLQGQTRELGLTEDDLRAFRSTKASSAHTKTARPLRGVVNTRKKNPKKATET